MPLSAGLHYINREPIMHSIESVQGVPSSQDTQAIQGPQNSRQAYINLALATLAFAVAFVAWSLISPLAKQLQTDLGLDSTQRAWLIAVPVLLGSLLRIPFGILTDRIGGRKMYTALLLFTLLPVAFLGVADSFWTYILGGLFLGA